MSTERIEEGSPNKFYSTRLRAEDVWGIQQKDGLGLCNRPHGLTHVYKKKKKKTWIGTPVYPLTFMSDVRQLIFFIVVGGPDEQDSGGSGNATKAHS
jgi:hypothetical protein